MALSVRSNEEIVQRQTIVLGGSLVGTDDAGGAEAGEAVAAGATEASARGAGGSTSMDDAEVEVGGEVKE